MEEELQVPGDVRKRIRNHELSWHLAHEETVDA